MIIAFVAGVIIGFILAIPPGPVAVTAMRLSMENGLKHGILASLGTGIMDFIYCLVVIFATSAILSLVNGFFDDYPIVLLGFQLLVITTMIIYGIVNLKLKKKITNPDSYSTTGRFKSLERLSRKGPFLLGIAVALANVANPTFLPALAYVTLHVQKFILPEDTALLSVIFSLAFGLGNFLWLYLISKVLVHYKDKMSAQALARVHQLAGFTLIGFGTVLGYRVLTLTHWSEIVRLALAF